jgi:hypothetical protein
MVRERPTVVLDRPVCEPLACSHPEPLRCELVERWLRHRLSGNGLRSRRPPNPAADVGEHVLQLDLGLRLRPSFVGSAKRDVPPLPVGAEAECERPPTFAGSFYDLACCWSAHGPSPFFEAVDIDRDVSPGMPGAGAAPSRSASRAFPTQRPAVDREIGRPDSLKCS